MTPIEHYPELANILGLSDLYFKREDLHPYGSHKGRSIPVMIDHYIKRGESQFAISSSGNAAVASALYVAKLNKENKGPIRLEIFVSKNISPHKLEKLKKIEADQKNDYIRILTKERPIQAIFEAIGDGYRSLRQSTDDIALLGYKTLADELSSIKNVGAIFIGTSSGTTAQALAEYFLNNKRAVQIHIVQTSSCHPISDNFESYSGPNEKSIADAIVGLSTERTQKLTKLINKTGGYGWTATNEDIETAKELVNKNTGLNISNNSALSIVGAMQAVYRDWPIEGSAICLICGE